MEFPTIHKEIFGLNIKLSDEVENYLLSVLKAKKGDIKTKKDLKRYWFKCGLCKEIKKATEGIILEKPLKIEQKLVIGKIMFEVSKQILLICQQCFYILEGEYEFEQS